jgi:hypothetical protein
MYAIEYTAGNGKRYVEHAATRAEAEAVRESIIAMYAAIPGMSAHADGVTITEAPAPAPAHAVGADLGRNVHCVCGAEFSRADSLIMHINGNTGDFGGSWGHPYGMEDYNASKHAGGAR